MLKFKVSLGTLKYYIEMQIDNTNISPVLDTLEDYLCWLKYYLSVHLHTNLDEITIEDTNKTQFNEDTVEMEKIVILTIDEYVFGHLKYKL